VVDDFFPIFVFILVKTFRNDLLSLFIEAHDLLSDGAGPASLLLVKIVKHPDSCASIAVIRYSFGEDGDESGFAGINIANDSEFDQLFGSLVLYHDSNKYKRIG
jgi:hypothetical protein